jgi:ribosomal protein S18 acetylase RimI-like enzyme
MAADGTPVGAALFQRPSEGQVAVDFIHVLRKHQRTETERLFLHSLHEAVTARQVSEVTVEGFAAGTQVGVEHCLVELGYESHPRSLMVRDLDRLLPDADAARCAIRQGRQYCLTSWGGAAYRNVAHLVYSAHLSRREPRMGGDSLEEAFTQIEGLARSRVFSAEISTLAMEGSAPVGVVMATWPTEEDLMIVEVAVAPARQGLGIGKAIMARALREAFMARAKRVWLVVNAANRPAIALYRSTGFSVSRPVINCRWRLDRAATSRS